MCVLEYVTTGTMGAMSDERTHWMKITIVKIKTRKRQQTDYRMLQNSNELFRSLV